MRPGFPAAVATGRLALAVAVLAAAGLAAPALATGTGGAGGAGGAHHSEGRPGVFQVGVAAVSIDPTYPVYLGGYGGGPAGGTIAEHTDPLTGRRERLEVRAMAVGHAGHVVELARVDTQGYFAGYQEGPYGITAVRAAAAAFLRAHGAPGATAGDILVSSLHEHAAPTLLGIWGPPSHNAAYLRSVAAATEAALAQAWLTARPATLSWGQTSAGWVTGHRLGQPNSNEGWPADGSVLALWARDARTGATIGTYVTEPGYPNIVYGPKDLLCPPGVDATLISTDFPSYAQDYLQRRLGGMALLASGSLGDQTGPMQGDTAPSPDLPPVTVAGPHGPVRCTQTRAFDDAIHMGRLIGNLTLAALGHARPVRATIVAGATRYLVAPQTNPALVAINDLAPLDGGTLWAKAGGEQVSYPIDRADTPPYQVPGVALGTWVTGLRIGGVLLLSEPGEFYPSLHAAWDRSIRGAAAVGVVGAAQDFLGYDYPVYAFPFALYSADEQIYNPSLALGDEVVTAGEQDARALGFDATLTGTAEMTALSNHYLALARPSLTFLPFPDSGDAGPGGFTVTVEAFGDPARVQAAACGAPGVGAAACVAGLDTSEGPFHWNFGDTTTALSGPGTGHPSFFPHTFASPGGPRVYQVRVRVQAASGQQAEQTLPVVVYPALQVSIVVRGCTAAALASGGSGRVLSWRWRLGGGRQAFRSTVGLAGASRLRVEVADSAGGLATATAAVPAGCAQAAGAR